METEGFYKVQLKCGCRWTDVSVYMPALDAVAKLRDITTSNPRGTYRIAEQGVTDDLVNTLPTDAL